jgi:hypothetical protein
VTKAALIGCLGGLLLVSQPELAARMSGVAALAVLPALGAGLWASRHASGLWQRLPEAMTHVDICRRAVAPLRRCVGVLLLGALARLVGGTFALSIAFFYLVPTLDPSAANLTVPLMEVGTFGLVMFVAGLLDAFRRTWSAVLVIAVSLFTIHALDAAAAAGFPATVGGFLPVLAGGAASLAVGVSVLLAVFREPDRAFATTM